MSFFKNKKVITIIGIIICILICLAIDYFVSNYDSEDVIVKVDNEESGGDVNNDKNAEGVENEHVDNENDIAEAEGEAENTNINEEDSDENIDNNIFVYVSGEVNNPGVFSLSKGCRINDAINAAGGITNKANISKINLVFALDDGMKINIPNDEDLKNNPNFEYVTLGSGDGISNSSYSVLANGVSGDFSENSKNSYLGKIDKVNINTATQTELETLPGIGPSLALKIINYRKENGNFSNIEEIKNVSGIGDSKFEDIKSYIFV